LGPALLHVAEALPLFCAVALINAVGVMRLCSRTKVEPAESV
jgi:hypothetical protein